MISGQQGDANGIKRDPVALYATMTDELLQKLDDLDSA